MDSYIILGAFNLHHLKVFASKRFLLWFHTANQWLPGVEVLFAEDNTIDIKHEHRHSKLKYKAQPRLCKFVPI